MLMCLPELLRNSVAFGSFVFSSLPSVSFL